MDTDNPIVSTDQEVSNPINPRLQVIEQRDPLTLDLDDKQFLTTAKKLVNASDAFYESKYRLKERRRQNEKYLFGRQIDDLKLKDYNAKYVDNVIWEAEAYLKPIALSRMPDVTVKPGKEDEQSKNNSEELSKVMNNDIQSRERRRILGLAFKHLPVYLVGVIKTFWNPEKGKSGDYDFKVVLPENITFDHTAGTNNVQDMKFIREVCQYSVKEVVMRFPNKEDDLYNELKTQGVIASKGKADIAKGLDTVININEIWFQWPEKVGGSDEYEMINGVAWYYGELLLDKMKNPNWDWEGDEQTFSFKYDETSDNQENQQPSEEDYRNRILTGQGTAGLQTETVFHNHFQNPEFPYILMGYDQWGKTPLDETTRIEQNIYLQQNLDKRGKQITEMLDRSRGKHIFSVDSGLKKEDIEELDMANPDVDLLIEGDVNAVHGFVQGEQPSSQMIEDKNTLKETILDKAGVHAAVRGQTQPETTATSTQIQREGDFTRADDLTEDTINYAAEKMANWMMQFIKLRYTEDHLVRILGQDGKPVFISINRDFIEDGMEVTVSASGVDKLKAQQNAFDMAKMRMIDPLSFFEDIHASDPVGRTEKLMLFMTQPDLYLQKYVINQGDMMQNSQNMANNLNGAGSPPPDQQPANTATGGGSQAALLDIATLQSGQIPAVPQQVDAQYVQTLMSFLDSPQFQGLLQKRPDLRMPVAQFLEQVQALLQQGGGQPQQPPTQPAQPTPPQAAAGPVSNNPQPGKTSQVNINPPSGRPSNV